MAAALSEQLAELEKRSGGRLGVAVLDTATGRRFGYRGDERFPMCSTFKALLAAAVLARVDQGKENLDRRITYGKEDLVDYSPVTEKHVGDGMTVAELCEAAITYSDNTAANLLLEALGGPAALTAFLRSIGDNVTRLDRWEPELNTAAPGDPRDTTTPAAMAATLRTLLLGDVLSPASRQQLVDWLIANKTGDKRLRAGLPADDRVGDKTGTGEHGTTNDIAVVWPPNRAPIFLAVYLTESQVDADARDAVIAEVARLVVAAWLHHHHH
uniref:Beta lactamase (GNCA4-2) n=1 Tax=synthetic construct TaxID=32630 RepID=UPI0015516330|nr:Chain A, Beta lactamase (GNCA4-2) [synthetic construct]6TY6_B Chain B, Beta lactamase (GNCA4-2) [synthetic construct]6TY6_C Chain C, Beta lactamase (GNCA4-2) [synthetic construct]